MSELKPSDVAAEAAIWGLIETEAKKRKDEARAWLTERMGPDLLAVAAVANGDTVGRASYVQGKTQPVVVDPAAFLKFVETHYPGEVETVANVNHAFRNKLLGESSNVDGVAVDANGLVLDGVEFRTGLSYVTVKKAADAREKVQQLLAGGQLSLETPEAVS